MIRDCYQQAFVELRSPQFRHLALIGAALSLVLLFALYALLIQLFTSFENEVFTFSDGTRMDRLENFFSAVSLGTMLLLSAFLMAPAASLFTGLHLHAVAKQIEARHYPNLAPSDPTSNYERWRESISYFGLLLVMNLMAFMSLALFGAIWGIVAFWGVNGWLLSREYSMMIAARHLDKTAIRALRRQHRRVLITAGLVFAVLLSVPFLNLLMPVIGVAAFTHLIHRLPQRQSQEAMT